MSKVRGRPRTWTDEQLERAVAGSFSWSEVAGKLGLSGANHAVRARADELGLERRHFRRDGMIDTRPRYDINDHNPWHALEHASHVADVAVRRRDTLIRQYARRGTPRALLAEHVGLTIRQVNAVLRGDA